MTQPDDIAGVGDAVDARRRSDAGAAGVAARDRAAVSRFVESFASAFVDAGVRAMPASASRRPNRSTKLRTPSSTAFINL